MIQLLKKSFMTRDDPITKLSVIHLSSSEPLLTFYHAHSYIHFLSLSLSLPAFSMHYRFFHSSFFKESIIYL